MVREEALTTISTTKINEYRSRINQLRLELEDKNLELQVILEEQDKMNKRSKDAFNDNGPDIKDQMDEIDELNARYTKSLRNKVLNYDKLKESIQAVNQRQSDFMKKEMNICMLQNLTSITKKQLDQKQNVNQRLNENRE